MISTSQTQEKEGWRRPELSLRVPGAHWTKVVWFATYIAVTLNVDGGLVTGRCATRVEISDSLPGQSDIRVELDAECGVVVL